MGMEASRRRVLLALVFVLAAGIRAVDLNRPADGRLRESWREADYASLARNFHREGMNILHPRIDWRGESPGFAEMEFPALPWATAFLYRIFGLHEVLGRILSWIFSLLTLAVFWSLARRLLPDAAALVSAAFLALSPLAVRVSNALQPESMMLFFLAAAAASFLRWLDTDSSLSYTLALASTAAAILAKPSAAHIGVFFLLLVAVRKGWRGLLRPAVVAFGVLALLPAALWTVHAHGFWTRGGLSLGVSNETHWIGWDLIRRPLELGRMGLRLLRLETAFVWTLPGILLAGIIVGFRRRSPAVRTALLWLAAIGLYYLLVIRTAADDWAVYYHVVSILPAALLMGAAFDFLAEKLRSGRALPVLVVALLLAAVFPLLGIRVVRDFYPRQHVSLYECAQAFRPLLSPGSPILATGGPSRDETGKPVAYNASYFFYWLDRKGFNIPADRLTLDEVAGFARRGAEYFILEKDTLAAQPAFLAELRGRYRLLAECGEAFLFGLTP